MKPRHFVLLAVLIAVAIFDYFHMHPHHAAQTQVALQQSAPVMVNGQPAGERPAPPSQASTAWLAYEHVANLRDAPPADFTPAMTAFESAKAAVPHTTGTYDAQDLDTCRQWLLEYRKNSMKDMAARHVDNCAKLHRDVAQ